MAILKIHSEIVPEDERVMMSYWGLDGVSYKSVDEFLGNVPQEDGVIDIRLHCPGGAVSEGWAIVDRLRATGKEIRATIEGDCASMASVILLAASVRRGAPHATLLIHDPFIPEYTLADSYTAEELQRITDDLAFERERILDFYVERTGSGREVLDAQMRSAAEMDMERAKELGFIQEITAPVSAWRGRRKHNFNDMSIIEKVKSAVTEALAGYRDDGRPKVRDLELNTADGDVITIDIPEGEDPKVGDKASPDGEWLMPDGSTIVIQEGEIAEIRPAEGEENPEPEPEPDETEGLRRQISELEARVTELEGELTKAKSLAKTKDEMEVLNLVSVAGGKEWLAKAKSNYRPARRDETDRGGNAKGNALADLLADARRANGMK